MSYNISRLAQLSTTASPYSVLRKVGLKKVMPWWCTDQNHQQQTYVLPLCYPEPGRVFSFQSHQDTEIVTITTMGKQLNTSPTIAIKHTYIMHSSENL